MSMGWAAARKLRRAIDNAVRVVAIEVMTAARAVELRQPLRPAPATAAVVAGLRQSVAGLGPGPVPGPGDRPDRRTWSGPGRSLAWAESVDRSPAIATFPVGHQARSVIANTPAQLDPATRDAMPASRCGPRSAAPGRGSITAATGSELHCRGWPQEAAWRMLHNNLDPAVAERPDDLVVYGGGGKAARDWPSFDAISRTLLELGDDETLLVQSGRPVGVLRTHEWAPRVLIANSNLVGEWDNWDEFRRLEHLGLTMYGQMTAGSWIYIGTQGILQGTYETFAAIAEPPLRRVAGRHPDAHRRRRRHGRGPAPGRDHERRGRHLRRCRPHPPAPAARDPLLRRDRRRTSTRPSGWPARPSQPGWPSRSAWRPTPSSCSRPSSARDEAVDIVTDQTPAHDPLMYVPVGLSVAEADELRRSDPAGLPEAGPRHHRPARDRHAGPARPGRRGVRLRQQPAGRGPPGRRRPGLRLSRLRPRLHPPAVLRGQRPVPLGGPVRRPGRHRRHRPGRARGVPRQRAAGPLDPHGVRPGGVPGPAGPDLLARPGRAGPDGRPVQRHGRVRPARRPDRHRPRPPRLRIGRLAVPRDRSHGRRLGCHRRLAAAQRHGQRGVGRVLGQHPRRRRRGHRPVAARRPGVRGGRHAAGRGQARAGPHQ